MKKLFLIFLLTCAITPFAMAQQKPFFDMNWIAQLFDSPIFFGCIVGSGALFFGSAYLFMRYMKAKLKAVESWGSKKETQDLIDLLDSPVSEESRMAFMYLREFGDEKTGNLVVQKMQDQRKGGRINPYLIYLAEDIGIAAAIEVLQAIAKGKSKSAQLAADTLTRFGVVEAEENAK
jgi:hypothetical protein